MRGDNSWRFHCIKFCYYSLTGTFMLSLIQRNSNHTKSKTGQFLHLSIDIFFFSFTNKVTGGPGIYIYIYIFLSFTNKSGPDNLFESTKSWCLVRSTDSCFYSLTGPLWLTLQ